jgi:hypothetical protein
MRRKADLLAGRAANLLARVLVSQSQLSPAAGAPNFNSHRGTFALERIVGWRLPK